MNLAALGVYSFYSILTWFLPSLLAKGSHRNAGFVLGFLVSLALYVQYGQGLVGDY